MQKAIVIYGSTGGNTNFVSRFVQSGLETGGYEVTRVNVRDAQIDDLKHYDLVVIGCSTWDEGKAQGRLQVDMQPFNEQLLGYNFNGQAVAVFGVGHYSYTFTCNAANILEETVKKAQGRLVTETFRISDVVDLYTDQIEAWASQIKVD